MRAKLSILVYKLIEGIHCEKEIDHRKWLLN